MWYDNDPGPLGILISAIIGFAWLIFLLRLAGKRTVAKFNMYDMILTFTVGSILASMIVLKDVTVVEGCLAMAVVVAIDWLLSQAALKSEWVRELLKSPPVVLVRKGEMQRDNMRKEQMVEEEIDMLLRQNDVADLSEVEALTIESAGDVAVIKRRDGVDEPQTLRKLRKDDSGIE
ncbi:hypothetical protein B7H23_03555 [Notoacmeibacter marinus]|uniref:DUF421 domain-containing protein n=1 Tax=Notoacmeibacter marinus TaxID=1876515 RepID=A0A231V1K0_9HYPH|nr:YetF domain-containing protein [Notoacmeibacter marinus]OXT02020.1 hypothetical protein B7H23_03555 [Notoacmeibacter marinus]